MTEDIRNNVSSFIKLNTDFGYEALGGIGRMGNHSVEQLESSSVRKTSRTVGPAKTFGRWLNTVIDALTPASWRVQGKFKRGLENFSAKFNHFFGNLYNTLSSDLNADDLKATIKDLSSLYQLAKPLTSRGADYVDLIKSRTMLNVEILRQEHPQILDFLTSIDQHDKFNQICDTLDPECQQDLIDDLQLIKQCLLQAKSHESLAETHLTLSIESPEAIDATLSVDKVQASAPKQSKFSLDSLKSMFLGDAAFNEQAKLVLQEHQSKLESFTGQAKEALTEAIQVVNGALADNKAHLYESSELDGKVEQYMQQAITCAVRDVVDFALQNLDSTKVLLSDGQDHQRITPALVKEHLDAATSGLKSDEPKFLEANTPELHAPSSDIFANTITDARTKVHEISSMYADLNGRLSELFERNSKYKCAVLLHDLATINPTVIDKDELVSTCDVLIELQNSDKSDVARNIFLLNQLDRWFNEEPELAPFKTSYSELAPILRRNISKDSVQIKTSLDLVAKSEDALHTLNAMRNYHQVVGMAGSLMQQAKLPQADFLISTALNISRQMFLIQNSYSLSQDTKIRMIRELEANIGRFASIFTLAQMQLENESIVGAITGAKSNVIDKTLAKEGLSLLNQCVIDLKDQISADNGRQALDSALQQAADLQESGLVLAQSALQLHDSRIHKETAVTEQIAVCLESGRSDAKDTLLELVSGSRWKQGKHLAVKEHLDKFLAILDGIVQMRDQSKLLNFLTTYLSGYMIVHDVYQGFDGNIHFLINTDKKNVFGSSKKIQTTRWITLPSPESLQAGKINTGVNRLDTMLETADNLTNFYPRMYGLLKDYFGGVLFNFDL